MPLSSSFLPSGIVAVATSPVCVELSCEGLFYTNPFCGLFLWDLCVPVAMYCICTAVAWGNVLPFLLGWAWELLPCGTVQVTMCECPWGCTGRTRQMWCSRRVILALFWEISFHGAPQCSGNVRGRWLSCVVWCWGLGGVHFEFYNRGSISAWVFRGEIIPAPVLVLWQCIIPELHLLLCVSQACRILVGKSSSSLRSWPLSVVSQLLARLVIPLLFQFLPQGARSRCLQTPEGWRSQSQCCRTGIDLLQHKALLLSPAGSCLS